jgi:hypothetical protein
MMKKKKIVRVFNFSDAVLVTKGKEKIAFMRRDAAEFAKFGITKTNFDVLEEKLNLFADGVTDIEIVNDQAEITKLKDAKAEELRVAIRGLMSRVQLVFDTHSSKYKKFGTEALAQQTDADLLIIAKIVVRVGTTFLAELAAKGGTLALLESITALGNDFTNLIVDMKIKMRERDVMQEERVEAANCIYTTLVRYTTTGQSIWTTRNVAKYNDYVLYHNNSGEAMR